jgi:hypothetical protein
MTDSDRKFFESIFDLNSNFGLEYNLFCCEEAILISNKLQTKEKIVEFAKMSSTEQYKIVEGLSSDHSGNTFNMSCLLAISYLPNIREEKINVIIDANS